MAHATLHSHTRATYLYGEVCLTEKLCAPQYNTRSSGPCRARARASPASCAHAFCPRARAAAKHVARHDNGGLRKPYSVCNGVFQCVGATRGSRAGHAIAMNAGRAGGGEGPSGCQVVER